MEIIKSEEWKQVLAIMENKARHYDNQVLVEAAKTNAGIDYALQLRFAAGAAVGFQRAVNALRNIGFQRADALRNIGEKDGKQE